MNKLNELNDLFGVEQLEFTKEEINKMITHYVQDGDYDLNDRADVEHFIETYCEEECISLLDQNCCYDLAYSLSCREIKDDSVVIGVIAEETKKECICSSIESMLMYVGGV